MIQARLWQEEMRNFPWGNAGAALWVVRQDGGDSSGPLQLLFAWSAGHSGGPGHGQVPLTVLLRTLQSGRGEEITLQRSGTPVKRQAPGVLDGSARAAIWGREPKLWTEPLGEDRGCRGAFAILFDAAGPWGEAVRLWGRSFAARISPLLQLFPVWPGSGAPTRSAALLTQPPTLFPVARFTVPQPAAEISCGGPILPLPRPVCIGGLPGAIGVSSEMMQIGRSVAAIAAGDVNVLLFGESGTGKDIVARAIHLGSDRREARLVGQNCAALPETLFESELFGHRAGAFTGAVADKPGLLEAAHGGTFFLDEIGDMPLVLQIKLLRVIQERQVRRIGELDGRPVDIRFVAATHKNLLAEIEAGRFRLDLYFRLKVVCLTIPPLRQRPEDIGHLLAYFLGKCNRDPAQMSISDAALAALHRWRWPGNVRELENEVHRLLALQPEVRVIRRRHLSEEIQAVGQPTVAANDLGTLRPLDQAGELLERYLIRKAIAATAGRKAAAARRLGLSRQGLYKKLNRYGMTDLIKRVPRGG